MITHAASRKQYTVLLDRPESVSLIFLVDLKGFEPTTLRMRTVRSPN